MQYVVVNDDVKCVKCKKTHTGGTIHLWDGFYSCANCYSKYEKELQPTIKSMLEQYFLLEMRLEETYKKPWKENKCP